VRRRSGAARSAAAAPTRPEARDTPAGPASTLLPLSERPTLARLYEAGPARSATAAATAATVSSARCPVGVPVRSRTGPAMATTAATGIRILSAGAKLGVRASSTTASRR
jgi:hypothetical protein